MQRAIAVVVIIAAIFLGYRYYSRSYAPESTYKKFAEEILHRHYDAAAALSDGLTARDLERSGSQEKIGAGPACMLSRPCVSEGMRAEG
jgi:hypothetical protein